jgi:hypothetical protein
MSLPHLMLHLSDAEVGKRRGRGNWYGRREKTKIIYYPLQLKGEVRATRARLNCSRRRGKRIKLIYYYYIKLYKVI